MMRNEPKFCKTQSGTRKLMANGILKWTVFVCVAVALFGISLVSGKITPVSAKSANKTVAPNAPTTAPFNISS